MTHKEFIKKRLEKTGEISRNDCLRNFISRLAPRITELKREGYEFMEERRDGDFVYVQIKEGQLKLIC